jgi:tripartite-type tricarboxylate transporter receptor subunit TctC
MLLAGLTFGVAASACFAQAFPDKERSISFIAAFPAGSGTDTAARLAARFIERQIGVPIPVVNKPGASGQLGYTELAHARPDGYTIGLVNLPVVAQLYLDPQRKTTFKRESFQILGMVNDEPGVLVVRADSPWHSARELMEAIKKAPNTIRAGSGGRGGSDHLFGQILQSTSGGTFRYVHFDGATQAMLALLGGHIDVVPTTISLLGTSGKSGQVRVLGVAADSRDPSLKDVPTLREQGYDVTFSVARIVAMPAGAPKPVVDKLAQALRAAAADPEYEKQSKASGSEIVYRGAEETSALWLKREAAIRNLASSSAK